MGPKTAISMLFGAILGELCLFMTVYVYTLVKAVQACTLKAVSRGPLICLRAVILDFIQEIMGRSCCSVICTA